MTLLYKYGILFHLGMKNVYYIVLCNHLNQNSKSGTTNSVETIHNKLSVSIINIPSFNNNNY